MHALTAISFALRSAAMLVYASVRYTGKVVPQMLTAADLFSATTAHPLQ
jgi:hypothetical protein